MTELKDILLDDEEILWSGRPEGGLMKPLAPFWRRKTTHFLWLAFFSLAFLVLLHLESVVDRSGMIDDIFLVMGVIVLIGVIFGSVAFFDFKDTATPHQHDIYAITNLRLIVINTERESNCSAFINSVCYLTNNTHSKHKTLTVHIGYGEDDILILHGLRDATKVEKMITEKFSIKEISS